MRGFGARPEMREIVPRIRRLAIMANVDQAGPNSGRGPSHGGRPVGCAQRADERRSAKSPPTRVGGPSRAR
jgi:hypothetical protein